MASYVGLTCPCNPSRCGNCCSCRLSLYLPLPGQPLNLVRASQRFFKISNSSPAAAAEEEVPTLFIICSISSCSAIPMRCRFCPLIIGSYASSKSRKLSFSKGFVIGEPKSVIVHRIICPWPILSSCLLSSSCRVMLSSPPFGISLPG